MSKVIKAVRAPHGVAFRLDDVTRQAEACLEQVRTEAARIVAEAQGAAQGVRDQAEAAGRSAAEEAIERLVESQVAARLQFAAPALAQAAAELHELRNTWLAQWERQAVHLATAIAERVIRHELRDRPEIPVGLVREALQLAAGSNRIRLLMHPDDVRALGSHVKPLLQSLGADAQAELVPDPQIGRGGCRVETEVGVVDQQFAVQLARIEEELI